MRGNKWGRLRRLILATLIVSMAASLVMVGGAYTNHATHPTVTSNTVDCMVQDGDGTWIKEIVEFKQSSCWTNEGAGQGAVDLTFDGASAVIEEYIGYDFALLFDGSNSPDETACKESAKQFATNILAQNQDARFTIIHDKGNLEVHLENSNDLATVLGAIDNVSWIGGTSDYVTPACEKAYDLHQTHNREDKKLMIVIIGDGDFGFSPGAWNAPNYTFTTTYHGDIYTVTRTGEANTGNGPAPIYYNDKVYYAGSGSEGWPGTHGTYSLTKNGEPFTIGDATGSASGTYCSANVMDAAFTHALYIHHLREAEQWKKGTVIASICTPKGAWASMGSTYAEILTHWPFSRKAVWAADEGYDFQINSNDALGYVDAFTRLETALFTKVVTINTTIDNRYFTVNEAALSASLPADCTYTLTPTTINGVAVEQVEVLYAIQEEQSLAETVSIPVTIKNDIPADAFRIDSGYLPVVYDGSAASGAAGCTFTDLRGEDKDIRTQGVYLNATTFIPPVTATLNPNGGSVGTASIAVKVGEPYGTLPDPTRTGYDFVGWFTQAIGGSEVTETTTVPMGDHTLYAHWTYDVIFYPGEGQGGTAVQTIHCGVATALDPGVTHTRPGYLLRGWKAEPFATTADFAMGQEVTDLGPTALYAHWLNVSERLELRGGTPVLRLGAWAEQNSAELTYYVRFNDAPLQSSNLDLLTFEINTWCDFSGLTALEPQRYAAEHFAALVCEKDGTTVQRTLTGTTTIDGLEFAEVTVTVNLNCSGIVRVRCGLEDTYTASGHYDVITPGDIDANGRVNAGDYVQVLRAVNGVIDRPEAGEARRYQLEMFDMDGNKRVGSTDYAVILRMLNGLLATN